MSAQSVVALVLFALMFGCTAGSTYQIWTAHYRNMEAMTGRYLAEKAWLDARTAEIMNEVERDAMDVKQQLKQKSRRGKQ